MAKSKNATSHHNARKHHRNGIKKLKNNRYQSLNGVILLFYMISAIKDLQKTEDLP